MTLTTTMILGSFLMIHIPVQNITLEVDLARMTQIESSGNPKAYNPKGKAYGLLQITAPVLEEFNQKHLRDTPYTLEDLYKSEVALEVGRWYLGTRIPELLYYYHKPITVNNILICWSAGIKYVAKDLELPSETIKYIEKYHRKTKCRP